MVHLIVECTRRQRKGKSKKKLSDSWWPAWLEMDRKVCPTTVLLLKQKKVEKLLLRYRSDKWKDTFDFQKKNLCNSLNKRFQTP